MAVNIKIHRGTEQIGGTITEIYTENSHIFIDFGSELAGSGEESTDTDMVQMIQNARCDGVLFTHYHGDHVGLLEQIPKRDIEGKAIRLGMGKVARQVLINIHKTLYKNPYMEETERETHKNILQILYDKERFVDCCDGVPILEMGDFKITPVRVDHSAYDAFLFIIEVEGKCIIHTGDFRTHGRLGKDLFARLSEYLKGKRVDVLLTEGTMMSRLSEKVLTEIELERRAYKELSKPENKCAFLICSSTNVESLASFHNAALKLKRPFIVNPYVYEQLRLYREYAGAENENLCFWKAYRFEPMYEYNEKLKATQPEYMKKQGFVMMVGAGDAYKERMEYFRKEEPLLIYSMWSGYLDEAKDAYSPKLRALYDSWPRHLELHTSGHAYKEDIEEMIRTVQPKEAIIPIHTERKEMFRKLDIGELRERVHPLSDGDCYIVGGLNMNSKNTETDLEKRIKKELQSSLGNRSIRLPGLMTFEEKGDCIVMRFHEEKSIGLGKGKLNMQNVNAAFEGWAVAVYTYYVQKSNSYQFIELDLDFEIEQVDFKKAGNGHYSRFLYRILRFHEQYDWFKLSDKLEKAKEKFEEFMKSTVLINNYPKTEGKEADTVEDDTEDDTEKSKTEHDVERLMINSLREELCKKLGINSNTTIYNQFPVGLFKEKVNDKNRFFTGGKSAIDLWAVADNNFYMMELKYANKMVGIITEAFFYINFVRDLLSVNATFHLNQEGSPCRGYDKFKEAEKNMTGFTSVLLADEFHPLVSEDVVEVLNANTTKGKEEKIEYKKIKYITDIQLGFE